MKDRKIYIAGHLGMVGSAIHRKLKETGYTNIVTRTIEELDLLNQQAVNVFFEKEKPELVVLAAAKVGGIGANIKYSAEFIYQNILIQSNVINAAYQNGVQKLIFLTSSTIYPINASYPLQEESLLTGPLDESTQPYAIAKISGISLCESYYKSYGSNFISLVLPNLYGINDHFDTENSHVVPALILKIHNAKIKEDKAVTLWGSGIAKREFLFSEDAADAIIYVLEKVAAQEIYSDTVKCLNIGSGLEITIKDLAFLIKEIVNYKGDILFDTSKPDGVLRKIVDCSKINTLGWQAKVSLKNGLKLTYDFFVK